MKGEWLRYTSGLVSRDDAIAAIEDAWKARQRDRFAGNPWWLYHDRSSDPDTLSVEAVGRGNLLALVHSAMTDRARRRFARPSRQARASPCCFRIPAVRCRRTAGPTIMSGSMSDINWLSK